MVKHIDIKSMVNARKARGMLLLEEGFEPNEINPHTWIVPSQKSNGSYTIIHGEHNRWSCTCKDFELKGIPCKHIYAVRIWKNFKEKFEKILTKEKQSIKSIELRIGKCKFCNSTEIIKYGKKNGKQNFYCKSCNRKFVNNINFENMKYSPKIIALTLDLYFKGVSLRKISHHLKEFYSLNICYKSVYNWIEKYVSIMNEYVNNVQPDIGEVWHTDEMMVNISGNWEYLWNIMDERTRFQLASVVSKERYIKDARMIFQRAKKNCGGRKPKYIVTDGLQAYKRAVKKEFVTNTHETEHLWNVGLQHHPNNNHVERLHGNIRDREKTMRGLKIEDTPIIEGHRLYYNFIKPHESLNGRTPSEEAGITIDGDNKWLSLMKNAIQYHNEK
jgi:putative transposase